MAKLPYGLAACSKGYLGVRVTQLCCFSLLLKFGLVLVASISSLAVCIKECIQWVANAGLAV